MSSRVAMTLLDIKLWAKHKNCQSTNEKKYLNFRNQEKDVKIYEEIPTHSQVAQQRFQTQKLSKTEINGHNHKHKMFGEEPTRPLMKVHCSLCEAWRWSFDMFGVYELQWLKDFSQMD